MAAPNFKELPDDWILWGRDHLGVCRTKIVAVRPCGKERRMTSPHEARTQSSAGSLDGAGAGDHDIPYCFGRRPRALTPYPFSTLQYARLLVLRSLTEARRVESDDHTAADSPDNLRAAA